MIRGFADIIRFLLILTSVMLVSFFAVATIANTWKIPLHNYQWYILQRHFREAEHPLGSKSLKKIEGFGNLFRAASNGCDYLVGELRVGDGSQEDIMLFYRGLSVRPFDDTEPVPIEVKFSDDEAFSETHRWSNPWFDWHEKIRKSFDFSKMRGIPYVVFAEQTGYPPYGDIRCFYEPAIY